MMVGILGFAQTGKDTVSELLSDMNFVRIAFADPLKRVVRTLFDFSFEQMWGTLEQKETPDQRYPREHTWNCSDNAARDDREPYCLCCRAIKGDPDRSPCFLTPRYALKIIGTEGARHCYDSIWGDQSIREARKALEGHPYNRVLGIDEVLIRPSPRGVIFTDCRFENEVRHIQNAGGKVFRIKRPGYDKPMFDHPSETEQLRIPDDRLQGVIENDGTLEDLRWKVCEVLGL